MLASVWAAASELLLDTAYQTFGEPALWPPTALVPVTVIRDAGETDVALGGPRVTADTLVLLVRKAEVASPAKGDHVSLGGLIFRVIAEPQTHDDQRREWSCEVAPLRS